ncbi:hypothetical protein BHE74_00003345 [Ensete ventricosum]|nr:hypothetical protein BHE74_00003345 [Ensete ventricosum]
MQATSLLQYLTRRQLLGASRLIVPHGQSPTIKSAVGRAASRPLSGALQASRPIASALPHGQPPTIKGVVGWSARRVCSAMPPTTHCQGRCRWVSLLRPLCQANSRVIVLSDARGQVSYGSVRTLHLPVVFAKARLASDMRPTWRHCDVAEVGVSCSSVGLTIIGLIILSPRRNPFRYALIGRTWKGL